MKVTIADVMAEVRNYFQEAPSLEECTMKGGVLECGVVLESGQWVALSGSVHNNGVFQLDENGTIPGAQDERWCGYLWLLFPPESFLKLCREIDEWVQAHPDASLCRESFGAYSYEQARTACGLAVRWQDVFRSELLPYRRLYAGVRLT